MECMCMDTSGRKKNLVILCGNIKTPFVRASGFSRGFTKLQTYKPLHWRSRGPSFAICTRRLIVEMSCLPSAIPFVPPHTYLSTLCTCGFKSFALRWLGFGVTSPTCPCIAFPTHQDPDLQHPPTAFPACRILTPSCYVHIVATGS